MILWVAASLGACSSPTQKSDSLAQHFGFRKAIVDGDGFRHVVYENSKPAPDGALHIYIDGDGTPYADVTRSTTDPTPRNLLMLRLMARDPADSVYVGRPCYFALQHDSICKPTFWTTARYGPQVLASMEAVLREESIKHAAKHLEIFGLSGGGVIAVLLAQRIDAVARVVTIGSNLDIDAWCDLHHYSRLVGSINPVEQPALRTNVHVLHLVGNLDTNTPPYMVQAAARQRGEQVRVVENFDHGCCWEKLWPTFLNGSP